VREKDLKDYLHYVYIGKMTAKRMTRAKIYKQVLSLAKKLKINASLYTKQYRKGKTDFWISERKKLRTAHLQLLRYTQKRNKNPLLLPTIVINTYTTNHSSMKNDSLKVRSLVHTIPKSMQLSIIKKHVDKTESQIKYLLKLHQPKRIKQKDTIRRQLEHVIKRRQKKMTAQCFAF
jgi:hypothetical protein